MEENTHPQFVGWMLWNMVLHYAKESGADWPDGIFEDQPERVRNAWDRAAADLDARANHFSRLI